MFLTAVCAIMIGFAGSVPVAGPIAVLTLDRALERHFRTAMAIAVGGAVAEALYAFAAAWGAGVLVSRYPWLAQASNAVGALLLGGLGVAFLRRDKEIVARSEIVEERARHRSFFVGFSITLFNPTLIATWGIVATQFAAMKVLDASISSAAVFAAGITVGIIAWFAIMIELVRRLHANFTDKTLLKIKRAMAILVWALAIAFAYRATAPWVQQF